MTVYYCDPSISENLDTTCTGLKYMYLDVDSHTHGTGTIDIVSTDLSGMVIPLGSYVRVKTSTYVDRAGGTVTAWNDTTDTITLNVDITDIDDTDCFYIITPWKLYSKVITTLAAGDTCYIRAGTTSNEGASIGYTNDGTYSSHITIKGMGTGSATLETTDATATEAWHDASTARPIVDLGNGAYYVNNLSDHFWDVWNVTFQNNNSSSYAVHQFSTSLGCSMNNCIFKDANNSSGIALSITGVMVGLRLVDCQFINAGTRNVYLDSVLVRELYFINCKFDSGSNTTLYHLYFNGTCGGEMVVDNCEFGVTTAATTADIYSYPYGGLTILFRNLVITNAAPTFVYVYTAGTPYPGSILLFEDLDGDYGTQQMFAYHGTITKDDTVYRTGGASSSAKMMPSSAIVSDYPLSFSFTSWCPASSKTFSIYIRSVTTWGGTYPTAAELYVEAEYVSDYTDGSIERSVVVSDEVLSDATTWVPFQVTLTPAIASFVKITVKLLKYTASNGVYVDVKPVVS